MNYGKWWQDVISCSTIEGDNLSIKIKALLGAHDIWEIVEKAFTMRENEATLTAAQKENLKELKKRENKANISSFNH